MESVHRRLLIKENTKSSYIPKTSFDTNMVIVLALLCAIIFALGLNLIVKYCAARCRPRQGEPASGLKKQALRKIPVAVFGSEMASLKSECSIFLGEILVGEKMRVLPKCKHVFHVKCIDKWLITNSSCPICRCALLERPTISLEAQVVAP